MKSWEDTVSHQNPFFQSKVKRLLKEYLDAIKNLYEQIDDSFTQKGWLKKKVVQCKPMLKSILTIVRILSIVLTFLGIEIGAILLFPQQVAAKVLSGDDY